MLFPCFLRQRRFSFLSCRSSRPEVFCKKGVFRNFTKFTAKHLRQGLFFDKVAGLRLLLNSFFLNRGSFLLTYFIWISWNQIKCNETYINCVSWNSLKNISQCIHAFRREIVFTKCLRHKSFNTLMCTKDWTIESRSVCLTEPNQNYP